jgi:ABC-type glycerol-3-phosphate transport system permease component
VVTHAFTCPEYLSSQLISAFHHHVVHAGDLYLSPTWLPKTPQWGNYVEIWRQAPLGTFFINSIIVTLLSIVGQILSASLVAYGFVRFRFPGRDAIFVVMLSTLMLPAQVTIIPTFLLFKFLGWLDTLKPLIIPPTLAAGLLPSFSFASSS